MPENFLVPFNPILVHRRHHRRSESKLLPNQTFLALPTTMPNPTKKVVAHTVLDQTPWMAPLSIFWKKDHHLGQNNTEFYAFMDVWEPIKVAWTPPKSGTFVHFCTNRGVWSPLNHSNPAPFSEPHMFLRQNFTIKSHHQMSWRWKRRSFMQLQWHEQSFVID